MNRLLVALVFVALGCTKPTPPAVVAEAPAALSVGSAAPAFSAEAHDGTKLDLAALKGHDVVLYFYPKDETPGCSIEADAFRDAYEKIKGADAVLIGVSADSLDSHREFAKSHSLPFPLISDPKGELATKYGVPFTAVTARNTIVIGKDGTVKKLYRSVDVNAHAAEILKDLGVN